VPAVAIAADLSTTAAEHKSMIERARHLMRRVHAVPALESLDGFSLRTTLSATEVLEHMPQGTPIAGKALTLLTWPTASGGADVDCKSRDGLKASQCGPGITLMINNPLGTIGRNDTDARVQVSLPMTPPPQRNGFDVYRIDEEIILTKARPGKPLFVPMTRAQYLEEMAREIETSMGGTRLPSQLRVQVDKYRAEITAMSPAERAERACSSDDLKSTYKPCGPADHYIARVNPDYFDRSLGRASVQLINVMYHESEEQRGVVIGKAMNALRAADLPLD
jgi:hypothetical protein